MYEDWTQNLPFVLPHHL